MLGFLYCFSVTSEAHLLERHMVPRNVKYKLFEAGLGLVTPNLNLFKINCQLPGFK